ncbi:DUF1822 family protein [Crocosphaera sp. UHCC 0190]|uniref:DUF1822 family protein n=1 Tax=Crocosphaera sp. UHCC 0190 TaxID=3110246 RepID=UPI002B1FA8BA|nr:DUF1822 family protein [Crocosphaera sp. UHCC 0190]MEA5511584.1 DUF1822 family protein [Crocosphaera sp. UHCC 0190]
MTNLTIESSVFRLLIPEEIGLDTDDYELANQMSKIKGDESQQWQAYLNGLGMLALEKWLIEHFKNESINRQIESLDKVAYLQLKNFRFCLIIQEEFLQDSIFISPDLIQNAEATAHFYVILEVLEEAESVMIRGFLSYDKLSHLVKKKHQYLSLFDLDTEPNHLLVSCQYLSASAIPLPQSAINQVKEEITQTIINLRQSLDEFIELGWQTLDTLLSPDVALSFATRSISEVIKVGKSISFDSSSGQQSVILLLTVTPAEDDKSRIYFQIVSSKNQAYLPPNLQLKVSSSSGKLLQEPVFSGEQDSAIQLNPFKGKSGKSFQIEVNFNDSCIYQEIFQL